MYYSNKYNSLRELTDSLNDKKLAKENIVTIFRDTDHQFVLIYKV